MIFESFCCPEDAVLQVGFHSLKYARVRAGAEHTIQGHRAALELQLVRAILSHHSANMHSSVCVPVPASVQLEGRLHF